MNQEETLISTLYVLWLPITSFRQLEENINQATDITLMEYNINSNWKWLIFRSNTVVITIDSLGFIYLDNISSLKQKRDILKRLSTLLNTETKVNIEDTFLNQQIGYDSQTEDDFIDFLEYIAIGFNNIIDKIKLEYIYSHLYVDLKQQESNQETKEHKYKISSEKQMKFSLDTTQEKSLDNNFHTILNRNFKNLLKKSIYHTHSLDFEKGEIYNLSIIEENCLCIADFVNFELFINTEDKSYQREELFCQVLKKAIQDTIEERTILHFLKGTREHYLSHITQEISKKNDLLKKLNAYLLDDVEKNFDTPNNLFESSEDESAVEIFIQNLLQTIPKFHMMDSKIKEAYYIKIGNTTTNLQVKESETIVNTLYYGKWKASVNFFINTASKVNESLTMYHQNKTLKELEDISYNANYQADIEDIRELQKHKALSLDEKAQNMFFLVAVAALAGEAPLIQSQLYFFPKIQTLPFWDTILINGLDILCNSLFYFVLLSIFIRPFIFESNPLNKKSKKVPWYMKVKEFFGKRLKKEKDIKVYCFEESDYDKHEYRSNKLLLSYSKERNDFEKHHIQYNHAVSSFELINNLKKVTLTQTINNTPFSFELFPQLLRETPITEEQHYIYRENYRISGNDRVATKLMYRYKINELTLEQLLRYMKEDNFMKNYANHLKNQDFSLEQHYEILEALQNSSVQLTLYIVYSFVLKFDNSDRENQNIYHYTIHKDQYRVHYHINRLIYKEREDFEAKQESLAKLIDIYFLTRLKQIKLKNNGLK